MGQFLFNKTPIDGLFVIEPRIFGDARGYFLEFYNKSDFFNAGLCAEFVQDNESRSVKGVLRGLHFQVNHPQGKLVRVTEGAVFDVAVDLRAGSPTFLKWQGVTLSSENKTLFYIPEGFAHGFLVLSDAAVFSYKCTQFYHPNDEGGIIYNDKTLDIKWPLNGADVILSDKDANAQTVNEYLKRK